MSRAIHRSATAILATGGVLGACASDPGVARISHIVLFKMHSDADAEAIEADSREKLTRIPTVATYHAGRHIDIGRTNIETDYDVCLTVGFDSAEDYREYLEHPLHVELVNDWRERWDRVRIYDVEDPTR